MTRSAHQSAQAKTDAEGAVRHEQQVSDAKEADPARNDLGKLHAAAGNRAVTTILGSGVPLASDVRLNMETRFGADFSGVRIHDDASAHDGAAALAAKAFTYAQDIVFSTDRFAPGTRDGKQLLAHELAHVVQQRRGGSPPVQQRSTLEGDASAAANAFANGVPTVPVAGASAPGVMRDHDDGLDDERDRKREKRAQREHEKSTDQRRATGRADAGKGPSTIGSHEAEKKLQKLEKHVQSPGGNQRSQHRRDKKLKKMERLLPAAHGSTLDKNIRKGNLDEAQRTPRGRGAQAQSEYVAGGPKVPGQELSDGAGKNVASHTRPDYSVYLRRDDGTLERVHVNLKSHQIHEMTPGEARGAAREILYQAVGNKHHLPKGEKLVISFAHVPSRDVQEAIKHELFREGADTPVDEIRFGTVVHREQDYAPEGGRQPLDVDKKARQRRVAGEKKAEQKKAAADKKAAAKAAAVEKRTAADKKAAPKKPAAGKKTAGKDRSAASTNADVKASPKKSSAPRKSTGTTTPGDKRTKPTAQSDVKPKKASAKKTSGDEAPKKAATNAPKPAPRTERAESETKPPTSKRGKGPNATAKRASKTDAKSGNKAPKPPPKAPPAASGKTVATTHTPNAGHSASAPSDPAPKVSVARTSASSPHAPAASGETHLPAHTPSALHLVTPPVHLEPHMGLSSPHGPAVAPRAPVAAEPHLAVPHMAAPHVTPSSAGHSVPLEWHEGAMAFGGAMAQTFLVPYINREFLQTEEWERSVAQEASDLSNQKLADSNPEIAELLKAHAAEIQAAQSEGRNVWVVATLRQGWQDTTDPDTGFSHGSVMTHVDVVDVRLKFEDEPYTSYKPDENWAAREFRSLVGHEFHYPQSEVLLEGTDSEVARQRLSRQVIDASMRTPSGSPPVPFEYLIVERLENGSSLDDLREYVAYHSALADKNPSAGPALQEITYWYGLQRLLDGSMSDLIVAAKAKGISLDSLRGVAIQRSMNAVAKDDVHAQSAAAYWADVARLIGASR